MRENRWNVSKLIPVIGVFLMIGSVALSIQNDLRFVREEITEKIAFDRTAMKLLPPDQFVSAANAFLWMGIIAGILCFGYCMLSEISHKGFKAILSLLALTVTLAANAFFDSMIYVDEGLPVMPETEIVQSGDFEFLYVRQHLLHNVQVYLLKEDMAYRVEGFGGDGCERTYEASRNWSAILEAYDVFVKDEDGDYHHAALIYTDPFIDYMKELE